jgi:hypothetical protein
VVSMDSEMEREAGKKSSMFDLVSHLHGGRSPP